MFAEGPKNYSYASDGGISFRSLSDHLRQFMDLKIAADLRPSADGSAVRTSLVASGG